MELSYKFNWIQWLIGFSQLGSFAWCGIDWLCCEIKKVWCGLWTAEVETSFSLHRRNPAEVWLSISLSVSQKPLVGRGSPFHRALCLRPSASSQLIRSYLLILRKITVLHSKMSSWRSMILRIGEKSPDYGGGTVDFKDHIVSIPSLSLKP